MSAAMPDEPGRPPGAEQQGRPDDEQPAGRPERSSLSAISFVSPRKFTGAQGESSLSSTPASSEP